MIQVLQGDGLPPYICQKCISKLNIAFQFKTQCESSDAKLRQCFENYNHLPPTPDLTGFIEVKKDDNNTTQQTSTEIFTQNSGGATNNLELKNTQPSMIIHSNELQDGGGILDSTETSILVQTDPGTSLYNIDKNTFVELKPEFVDLKGVDTNLKVGCL